MVNSIRKGKSFELETAHLLTKITRVARWNRVPNSGGIATIGATDDPRFAGDLYTDDKHYSDIVVECKIQKKPINLQDLVNPKSEWNSWLEQTRNESKGKTWLLFFRWNSMGRTLMAAPTNDKAILTALFDVPIFLVLRQEEYSVWHFE